MAEKDIADYYEQHGQLVYRYLLRLCGDDSLAAELTQETFYQAIRTVDRYRGDCKPSVWLCQIGRHCWYKHLQKERHTKGSVEPDESLVSDAPSPEDAAIANDDKMRIYMRMRQLRPDVREVLYLRILGELSFAEIGKIIGRTENWARVTYFRGKKRITGG